MDIQDIGRELIDHSPFSIITASNVFGFPTREAASFARKNELLYCLTALNGCVNVLRNGGLILLVNAGNEFWDADTCAQGLGLELFEATVHDYGQVIIFRKPDDHRGFGMSSADV